MGAVESGDLRQGREPAAALRHSGTQESSERRERRGHPAELELAWRVDCRSCEASAFPALRRGAEGQEADGSRERGVTLPALSIQQA